MTRQRRRISPAHSLPGNACVSQNEQRRIGDGWCGVIVSPGLSIEGRRNFDPTHAGGDCGVHSELSIFENQAFHRRNTEALGGDEVRLWVRLGMGIVFGADQGLKTVE